MIDILLQPPQKFNEAPVIISGLQHLIKVTMLKEKPGAEMYARSDLIEVNACKTGNNSDADYDEAAKASITQLLTNAFHKALLDKALPETLLADASLSGIIKGKKLILQRSELSDDLAFALTGRTEMAQFYCQTMDVRFTNKILYVFGKDQIELNYYCLKSGRTGEDKKQIKTYRFFYKFDLKNLQIFSVDIPQDRTLTAQDIGEKHIVGFYTDPDNPSLVVRVSEDITEQGVLSGGEFVPLKHLIVPEHNWPDSPKPPTDIE